MANNLGWLDKKISSFHIDLANTEIAKIKLQSIIMSGYSMSSTATI